MVTSIREKTSSVIYRDFLTDGQLASLRQFVLSKEPEFEASGVIPGAAHDGGVHDQYRRSRVLMRPGIGCEAVRQRILDVLPATLDALMLQPFSISSLVTQITASNDGDFYRIHRDWGKALRTQSREITFVYYFHFEPKCFDGGELRLYDRGSLGRREVVWDTYDTIAPENNTAVFFASSAPHEVCPVRCPSRRFTDGRFTVNGWIHRQPAEFEVQGQPALESPDTLLTPPAHW